MKKLLTLCLLVATAFTVNAQQKPTKEETVAYINKTLQMSMGYNRYVYQGNVREMEYKIKDYSFLFDKLIVNMSDKYIPTDLTRLRTEIYSKIPWDYFSELKEEPQNAKLQDENLIAITVRFSTKLRFDQKEDNVEVKFEEDWHYINEINFYVIKTKADSFKKAIERLGEIAKEENKDPFKN